MFTIPCFQLYCYIELRSDWTYRVRGHSLADLFIQAAHGLYSLVGMQLAPKLLVTRTIKLKGIDRESLLVAWLNELLYLHKSKGLRLLNLQSPLFNLKS